MLSSLLPNVRLGLGAMTFVQASGLNTPQAGFDQRRVFPAIPIYDYPEDSRTPRALQ
jgi:hypothetical protein